ncbi:MAG: hypothetical protein GTN78_00035, partial [Gemmatimonadales bacterium]|nr:hypothetical protein [Gemmatimonadales bacterium]NIN10566.1 hypothetical protein [Gemmatimonadales bacterium]NIQ98581.1 hypothetical protein [Gemmatimonadales bacterium]
DTLSPGVYQLVASVEAGALREVARRPLFGAGGVSPRLTPTYEFCWGDMHAHSEYSDGVWLPEDVYEFARDTAQLDFFALTDHDVYPDLLTQEEYDYIVSQADAFDEPGW